MTRAASCANPAAEDAVGSTYSDTEFQQLMERLCDTDAEVVFFPVRHHSPASAMLVGQLIERLRPAAVLVEGPSDFNSQIDELLLDHTLPIAIYSYFRSEQRASGAYYPFCEYSPEWSALQAARRQRSSMAFIDLPWTEVAAQLRLTHLYADDALRRGRYVQQLCDRLGVENFDDLWDKLVESQALLDVPAYMQRVHSLCCHIRLWEERISVADQRREVFMDQQIRRFHAEVGGPLMVVTGGFHSSALAAMWYCLRAPGVAEAEPSDDAPLPVISDAGISLTSYSYERLDNLKGYNAGMPSPGFYEHAWRQRQSGEHFDHRELLVQLVQELRRRKQTISTADLIAVETAAYALAALRGRPHVWRCDLVDAVTTALLKDELEYGCESPFLSAIHAVLRGDRRGRLAAGTQMPPLVLDIQRQLAEAKLDPPRTAITVDLDLLTAEDQAKSRLLHRLTLLGVAGFDRIDGTDFLARTDLLRLWERWRVRWSPEFEGSCIEASRYGTSLAEAVAARLTELARTHERDASAAAELLLQAAQAGIDTISAPLLERLAALIGDEGRFTHASRALLHILFLYCHDEALGTSRLPQLRGLLAETFGRSLWLLEMLGQSSGADQDLVEGMRGLLDAFQRCADAVGVELSEFVAVIRRVEKDPHKPASVRGAGAGILWTLEAADEEQILADMMLFAGPTELGDFLSGLFAVAREIVQRHARLMQTIDRLLNEFNSEDFQAALPPLRLAFTYFTPREKHYMLSTLFEALGLKQPKPLSKLTVPESAAAEALAFEERLFESLVKYGLEDRHG